MKSRTWRDVVDMPFPEIGSSTSKTQEILEKQGNSLKYRMGYRLAQGRIVTEEKREERRKLAAEYF